MNDLDLIRGFGSFPSFSIPLRNFLDYSRRMESSLRYEIQENEDSYVISCEMPGVPKDKIDIQVEGNMLKISGSKRLKSKGSAKEGRHEESSYYEQFFTLPAGIDSAKVEADYEDGILHIAVPKGETKTSRKIKIGAGDKGLLAKIREKTSGPIGAAEMKSEKAA